MAVVPTFPGVYVEEAPSGVRTISGVSTAITAFVGYTRRGPLDTPVRLSDFGAFEREFGGLDRDSPLSYGVQQFFLNGGADAVVIRTAQTAQTNLTLGADGTPPTVTELLGNLSNKTGIYALEDEDLFNLLCIPDAAGLGTDGERDAVNAAALAYCRDKRAFYVVDPPPNQAESGDILAWKDAHLEASSYGALYFPWVQIPDPLDEFRLRPMPPSGTVAGVFARTDARRGVWKAPAGTEATLTNVGGFAYRVTDAESGRLNPQAVNALRVVEGFGRVVWGARTLRGADQQADEYKYVPVRRLALYIEESLYRGLHWVVFEPNDEPLWGQIRLNVGAFMNNLFRQGALQGTKPADAYFVRCDKTTTTQNDVDRGIVNVLIGFAPLKPAEFVVIKLQQKAGELQT